jgi:hypothetical protein
MTKSNDYSFGERKQSANTQNLSEEQSKNTYYPTAPLRLHESNIFNTSGTDEKTKQNLNFLQSSYGNISALRYFSQGIQQRGNKPDNKLEKEAQDFASQINENTDIQRPNFSRTGISIQLSPADGEKADAAMPKAEVTQPPATTPAAAEAPTKTPTPGLIVEDSATELLPGQMKRSEFLAQLRASITSTAEEALSGTIWSVMGCPWISHWFGYYGGRDAQSIERAIQLYAPGTSGVTSAAAYIPIICARVRSAIAEWSANGAESGVPESAATGMPGAAPSSEGGSPSATPGPVSLKAQEGNAGKTADPAAIQTRLDSGRPLDGNVRTQMESAFSQDFSGVRVHNDSRAENISETLNARAFTIGKDVAFASGEYKPGTLIGDALIAHELAHVVQQQGGASGPLQKGDAQSGMFEEDADTSAVGAMVSLWGGIKGGIANIAGNAMPRLKSGLRLQRCSRSSTPANPLLDAYSGRIPWTAALARQALNEYQGLPDSGQETWVNTHYGSGAVSLLLNAIPASEIAAGGPHNATVQSILQRVQRTGALSFAATQGLTSQAAMAQEQATFMRANNAAAAQALVGPAAAPTPAQVAAQQSTQVASTSIATQTAVLSAADEALWNTDATAAVTTFVTWVQANHAGLNITAADLRVDARAVFDRGQGVIAFSDAGKAVVGRSFTLAVNANPAYALPTVVHELRGHQQYGPYAQPRSEFGLELYDQAAALMPGYTQPADTAADKPRTREIDAYGYQETEIYSLMLEVPHYTPNAPAHASLSSINYDPAPAISARIGLIKTQWEPRVAKSLLRGLVLRFRNNFTAAEATVILQ